MALGDKIKKANKTARTSTPIANENPLVVIPFKEWFKQSGFKRVAPLMNENVNGFPFITFLTNEVDENGRAVAENIYITKASAEKHPDVFYKDAEINLDLLKELSAVQVMTTTLGDENVLVWRLAVAGEGTYLDLDEMFSDDED